MKLFNDINAAIAGVTDAALRTLRLVQQAMFRIEGILERIEGDTKALRLASEPKHTMERVNCPGCNRVFQSKSCAMFLLEWQSGNVSHQRIMGVHGAAAWEVHNVDACLEVRRV